MTFIDIALIVLGAYVIMIVGWVILNRIDAFLSRLPERDKEPT